MEYFLFINNTKYFCVNNINFKIKLYSISRCVCHVCKWCGLKLDWVGYFNIWPGVWNNYDKYALIGMPNFFLFIYLFIYYKHLHLLQYDYIRKRIFRDYSFSVSSFTFRIIWIEYYTKIQITELLVTLYFKVSLLYVKCTYYYNNNTLCIITCK